MNLSLEDLSFELNKHVSAEGVKFNALPSATEDSVLEVVCSNNSEFPINIVVTDTQLLAVTPLFHVSEVQEDKIDELNQMFLQMSPAVPLSSLGLQTDGTYILFGAMSLDTTFSNIAHELEVQAENTLDVLEAIQSLLK